MPMQMHWKEWGGAAGGALLADYAANRMKPLVQNQSNGRLTALALLAVQVFGWGRQYRDYINGAADWAAGDLARGLLASRLGVASAPVVVAPAATTPASGSTAANTAVAIPPPAQNTSAAFDNPSTGY